MRSAIFFAILFFTPVIVAGQEFKHVDGFTTLIDDLGKPVAADVRETGVDLLRQAFAEIKFDPERSAKAVVNEGLETRVVEDVRGLWFAGKGAEHFALIAHLRNPWNIRSGYIHSSILFVFRLENLRLKLLDRMVLEHPQGGKPTASFHEEAAIVPMRNGKNADHAFTLFTTKEYPYENKIVQKFRLFALENNRLKVVLDDLPALVTTNKCGKYIYENEQMLREIKTAGLKNGRFKLELMILDFFTTSRDCRNARANSLRKVSIYEAVWNARRGRYRTSLKSVETEK